MRSSAGPARKVALVTLFTLQFSWASSIASARMSTPCRLYKNTRKTRKTTGSGTVQMQHYLHCPAAPGEGEPDAAGATADVEQCHFGTRTGQRGHHVAQQLRPVRVDAEVGAGGDGQLQALQRLRDGGGAAQLLQRSRARLEEPYRSDPFSSEAN